MVPSSEVVGATSIEGFLLSRNWRDTPKGISMDLWIVTDSQPVCVTMTGQEVVMFVERGVPANASRRQALDLKSLAGTPVDALYFSQQSALTTERERLRRDGILPFEADVKPVERFLMERFVTGGLKVTGAAFEQAGVLHFANPRISNAEFVPRLSILSMDVETDGFTGPLLSIAGATSTGGRVFIVRNGEPPKEAAEASVNHVIFLPDEASVLRAFCEWVQSVDPDLLIGWNVVDFDLDYLAKLARRLRVPLALGRQGKPAQIRDGDGERQPKSAHVPGRVVLDGIATMRSATIHFESYALEDVAREMLGRGKEIATHRNAVAEILRMAREEPLALARYNLQDCRLVLDIFERARLVDFVVERQRLTGLSMSRQGGSVAAFDQLYLPRLHRAGYVAPSVGDRAALHGSPGGYVMDSAPGLYRNVIVLDFKSLYPSIIRTFLVDPLGLAQPGESPVPGYDGGTFAREGHILPELIRAMWQARDGAKREKNAALSQAIKIMMNSFYGVLGTPGCRFFDHRLVSSITKRGHEIIQRTRTFIEARGMNVIYGDTDSVFVLLEEGLDADACDQIGRGLATDLTKHFQELLRASLGIESHLELEYETHYQRFLMPTIRGSEVGTKKRYAGAIVSRSGEMRVVFKGLEAVRTDWTPLARTFQRELFRRVFADEPHEEFVRQTAQDLLAGRLDSELVYRKRLRREVAEYQKNVPPHVQAARKLDSPGRRIEYVITKDGPQPVSQIKAPLDYQHYLERQLAPAAQSLLHFLGEDFGRMTGSQLALFD